MNDAGFILLHFCRFVVAIVAQMLAEVNGKNHCGRVGKSRYGSAGPGKISEVNPKVWTKI